jgi:phospholipase/carboxylesterase
MTKASYDYFEKLARDAAAPLFFTFHGTGGDEYQFVDVATTLSPMAHIIAPRGDVSENGALRFFRRTGEGLYDMKDLALRTSAMANFISAHRDSVNATKVIGLGYSNGANILASVLLNDPRLFDEVVLLHPLISWQPAADNALLKKRILITAGKNDPICPSSVTGQLERFFREQNANVSMHWHEGGHELRQTELEAAKVFLNETQ